QGAITTIAGGADFVGDGGLSINATLFAPKGLAIDAAGRLLVADRANQRVRRVDINNASIITVAGTGAFGDSPDGLDALRTNFTLPSKVAVDSDGNIYTNDFINIRKIDAMTTKVETLVSSSSLSSFALDSRSNIFFVDIDCHCLRRFDAVTKQVRTIAGTGQMGFGGDGGNPATAQLSTPRDVFIDGADNIYIVDTGNNRIRRIEADLSRISTIVGNGQAGFSGDGGAATSASLREPQAVAVDPAGNIFVADSANNTIRFVNIQTGIIATIAGLGPGREGFSGDGGFARLAQLNRPEGLVVVGSGVIFVADTNNNCVRAIATREGENEPRISTLAGNSLTDFLGENIPAIRGRLFRPTGIAFNQTGALHIGEFESGRVRRIDPTSQIIQTVVGLNRGSGLGDGGSAQNAFLQSIQGIAFDRSGNLYIVDKFLARVRRVNIATGIIETFAGNGSTGFGGDGGSARQALLNEPSRIAFDNDGNAFISDTENHRIRRVDVRTGIITTVAGSGQNGFSGDGGLATSARLSAPEAIAIDLQGNLYIGDSDNRRVRRVDGRTGIITTIAGSEQLAMGGLDGDGGLAINAALSNSIADIKFDTGGNLYFTDTFLGRVRKVDLSTGIISRVAGSGFTLSTDFADGASALQANLRAVAAIAFDSAGNLFISDNDNNALRVVKGVASTGGQPATVTITAATFNRPNFVLSGTGFGQTGARVEINGVDVSQRITSQNSQQITLKGNKKKLNLRNGANQIVVRVGTAVSNTFVFNFLSEESFFNTKWTKWSCRLPRR
ncbi:MAG: hypothetical protein JNN15_17800, partial [Blastocatellia bacterium]|nr:hypothetical protein [Blastocatellia bacterium]